MQMYKFAEHTADIKIIAESRTFKGLFQSLANAFIEVVSREATGSSQEKGQKIIRKKFSIKTSNKESKEALVVDFLEKLLVFCEINCLLPQKIRVLNASSKNNSLSFCVAGKKGGFSSDVKAITYHQLILKHNDSKSKWQAEVVLDV